MVGADRHRYIVALDFGTTFTGISHVTATKKSVDDILVIKNWPGPSKEFSEVWKTPSKIAYRSENGHLKNIRADAEEVIWGYDVEPGMTSYSWMKLRLDQHTKVTEYDDISLARLGDSQGDGLLMLPPGKSAVEVCIDYLAGVYKYTMKELKRTWGDAIVDATPIDFWVTMPATWSDQAQGLTRTAALTAGFASRTSDRIFMITEPEAAAVAVLSGLIGEGVQDQIHAGDGILVCDCGGGTVDITTYLIKSTCPALEFEELAVGQGGKVGSSFIDRQFHEWLCAHFGVSFYQLDFKKKGPGSRLMKEFEAIKRDFGSSRNSQIEFRVPLVMKDVKNSKYYDEDEHMVVFSRDDLASFFEPSIMKIKSLLQQQIEKANSEMNSGKTVNVIILVGGFGDSQHLYDHLLEWCAEKGGLRLLCPPHPQAAIVKGAALRGLTDIKPTRRLCRRHYGLLMCVPFVEGRHPEHLAYTDQWSGSKYCDDTMSWEIKKGNYVTEQTKLKHALCTTWSVGAKKEGTVKLYASSLEEAPALLCQNGNDHIGDINYDFEDLDMSRFQTKVINGRRAYKVKFTLEIYLGHKQGTLAFKVVSQGEEIGSATIEFHHENDLTAKMSKLAFS